MEGHCSTGQSPQWAVVPMEEEEEEEVEGGGGAESSRRKQLFDQPRNISNFMKRQVLLGSLNRNRAGPSGHAV